MPNQSAFASRWKLMNTKKKKSPHRHTRTVGEHTSRNVHRAQLLEQKLGRIRNMHLRDPVLVIAQSTLE